MSNINIEEVSARIEAIESIKIRSDYEELFKKILYTNLICAISAGQYPEMKKQDRKRFILLIADCSEWPFKNYISIPATYHSIEDLRTEEPKSTVLGKWVNCLKTNVELEKKIDEYASCLKSGKHWGVSDDIVNTAQLKEPCNGCLKTYSHVLYDLRNDLTHNQRNSSYSLSGDEFEYITYNGIRQNLRFILNFSSSFIRDLVFHILKVLEEKVSTI